MTNSQLEARGRVIIVEHISSGGPGGSGRLTSRGQLRHARTSRLPLFEGRIQLEFSRSRAWLRACSPKSWSITLGLLKSTMLWAINGMEIEEGIRTTMLLRKRALHEYILWAERYVCLLLVVLAVNELSRHLYERYATAIGGKWVIYHCHPWQVWNFDCASAPQFLRFPPLLRMTSRFIKLDVL